MSARRLGMALVALVAILSASCSSTPKRTITVDEAVRRIDSYVQETLRAVPTSLQFANKKVVTDYGGGCVKGISDSDFTGQVTPSVTYTAPLSTTGDREVSRFLDAVAAYWKGKSRSVTRGGPTQLTVHLRNSYRIFVSFYPAVPAVELGGALDDCIWRNGTPETSDKP